MKTTPLFLWIIFFAFSLFTGCQREYFEETEDKPTETIDFVSLVASKDSAYMFDTIVIRANVKGEGIQYKWQKNKGSLVPVKGDPSSAYFWGCPTCTGWLTVECTAFNEYGSYTKNIQVYVIRKWKY